MPPPPDIIKANSLKAPLLGHPVAATVLNATMLSVLQGMQLRCLTAAGPAAITNNASAEDPVNILYCGVSLSLFLSSSLCPPPLSHSNL